MTWSKKDFQELIHIWFDRNILQFEEKSLIFIMAPTGIRIDNFMDIM